jgi:hypothetical protein
VQLPELAQFAEGIVTLLRGREGDDAVWRPFVWAKDGRFRVSSNEG